MSQMQHNGRGRGAKWALAVVLCAAAAGAVWFRLAPGSDAEADPYAVRPDTLRAMVCDACGATMKMTVAEFEAARKDVDPETRMLICPECKEARLWRAPSTRGLGDFKASREQIEGAVHQDSEAYAPLKPNVDVDRRRKAHSQ